MGTETPKTVIITGVTRGLGKALAGRFIDAGHTVWGCGRSQSDIQALKARWGAPHYFESVDVSKGDQVQNWLDPLLKQLGAPDLLLNNAGVINGNAPLWEISEDEFAHVLEVHLKGSANLIRVVVPSRISRGRGVIVNFSSTWGRSVSPDVAPYCAAKWGIEGMTRALAQELPRGLSAVSLNPGVIDTEMLRSCLPGMAQACIKPGQWSQGMVDFLLQLGPEQNGKALTAP